MGTTADKMGETVSGMSEIVGEMGETDEIGETVGETGDS